MQDENCFGISSERAAGKSAIEAAILRVAYHTAWLVVGRAGSHLRGSIDHQLPGLHACDRGGAVEASGIAFLWHFYDFLWVRRRGRRPDRSGEEARALVAGVAYDTAWAVYPRLRPRRVPRAALSMGCRGDGFYQFMLYSMKILITDE